MFSNNERGSYVYRISILPLCQSFFVSFSFSLIKIFFHGPIDAFRKMMYDIYVQYYGTMLRKEG